MKTLSFAFFNALNAVAACAILIIAVTGIRATVLVA